MRIVNIILVLLFFSNCFAVRNLDEINEDFANRGFSVSLSIKADFPEMREKLFKREEDYPWEDSDPRSFIVIKNQNKNIIGAIGFRHKDNTIYMYEIEIEEQSRDLGLGSLLYEYLFAYCPTLGCNTVFCVGIEWDYGRNHPALASMLNAGGLLERQYSGGGDLHGVYRVDFQKSSTDNTQVIDAGDTDTFRTFSRLVFNQYLRNEPVDKPDTREILLLYNKLKEKTYSEFHDALNGALVSLIDLWPAEFERIIKCNITPDTFLCYKDLL